MPKNIDKRLSDLERAAIPQDDRLIIVWSTDPDNEIIETTINGQPVKMRLAELRDLYPDWRHITINWRD